MFANVNGTRLYYTDTGGELPLIGVHGGMGIDGSSLRVQPILELAAHGVRVIIPDQRGHGRSLSDRVDAFTHEQWVRDLHDLSVQLNVSRFALLGHSYGGFLALECALRWPELLTHLILVGTSAGPRTLRVAHQENDVTLSAHFRERWPSFFAGANKHWELFQELRFSAAAYNAACERELPKYDLRDQIAAMTVPTTLVCGDQDWYRPDMEWLARELPSASLTVIQDAGHFVFLERPSEFTRIVAETLAGARS